MKPTQPLPPIDLNKLPHLSDLFALFNGGRHLNRIAEPVLWAELAGRAV